MNDLHLISVFMVGLLGSVHCVGMCGGIVSAFSLGGRPGRGFPVPVVAAGRARGGSSMPAAAGLLYTLAYNGGRLASYATAGALAGGLAGSLRAFGGIASLQQAGYGFANLMLIALGLYLMNVWNGLTRLETAGQVVWRRVQPLLAHVVPVDRPGKAFALGALWGWVPCGMVYSVLMSAMMSGSAANGAAVMLAFGLGTLPMLLSLGMLGARLQAWTRLKPVRVAGGVLVLAFGLLGLARAVNGALPAWADAICITPGGAGWHR